MKWKLEKRKLGELKQLENNPRIITKEGLERLKKDIEDEDLGDFKPVFVIDTNNIILAGNQKYKIYLEKYGKDQEVNVSIPEKELTEKQKKRVIILDNKHRGEDNIDILEDNYKDILEDLEFDNLLPEDFDEDELLKGMPSYESKDLQPYRTLYVHFNNEKDIQEFAKLINQKITDKTKYIYYPKQDKMKFGICK